MQTNRKKKQSCDSSSMFLVHALECRCDSRKNINFISVLKSFCFWWLSTCETICYCTNACSLPIMKLNINRETVFFLYDTSIKLMKIRKRVCERWRERRRESDATENNMRKQINTFHLPKLTRWISNVQMNEQKERRKMKNVCTAWKKKPVPPGRA